MRLELSLMTSPTHRVAGMLRRLLWLAALFASAAAADSAAPAPEDFVPTTHWAYDALQSLGQAGAYTGIPDGNYQGKRSLTRAEFAEAIHTMLGDAYRKEGEGWADIKGYHDKKPFGMRRLIKEFAVELAARNISPRSAAEATDFFETSWITVQPTGIMAPLPGVRQEDSRLIWPTSRLWQRLGEEAADRELANDAPSLWVPRDRAFAAGSPDAPLLLPAPGATLAEQIQQVIGHNRRTWAAIEAESLRFRSGRPWVDAVFHPSSRWLRRSASSPHRVGSRKVGRDHLLRVLGRNIPEPTNQLLLDGRSFGNILDWEPDLRLVSRHDPVGEVAILTADGHRLYALELRTRCLLSAMTAEAIVARAKAP
jgi:hypothetical protein